MWQITKCEVNKCYGLPREKRSDFTDGGVKLKTDKPHKYLRGELGIFWAVKPCKASRASVTIIYEIPTLGTDVKKKCEPRGGKNIGGGLFI